MTPNKPAPKRILLVEDNAMLRSTLSIALRAPELEIVTAINGVEGLALFHDRQGKFDVVITDNEMPQMDGLKLIQELRQAGFKGAVAVMSGNMSPQKLEAYRRCDISGFFQKPFQAEELSKSLSLRGSFLP